MPDVPFLVLAAGASSRMGTPKQLLPWGQTTLLGHTLQTLMKFDQHPIYVVLGAFRNKIRPEISPFPIKSIFNAQWAKGMGLSIAVGMQQILNNHPAAKGVLIGLGDQPLLDAAYYSRLIEAHDANPNTLVVSAYTDGRLGVPAVFSNVFFDALLALNEDQGARALIEKHKSNAVIIKGGNLTDVDTMATYRNLKQTPTPLL